MTSHHDTPHAGYRNTLDEPPVRLSPIGMKLWTGETTMDDRSGLLWAIAKELAKANATIPTIAGTAVPR